MTPYQTFGQTAVPSNMQFPTAAYLQSSQNAADIQARGYEALGKGISSGISSLASGYQKYKETKADVGAAEKSYDFFRNYLPEETRNSIDTAIEKVNSDPNMSLTDKKAFWEKTHGTLGAAINQAMSLQKSKQEQDAAMARTQAMISGQQEQPFYNQSAGMMGQTGMAPNKSFGYAGGVAPQEVSLDSNKPFSFGSSMWKTHSGN